MRWGFLPNRDAKAVRSVASGSMVTFDTVSHEGILDRTKGVHGRISKSHFVRR